MGAERSQWQFPANEVGKVIGWSDEASPSNPNASKGLVNKGPFLATADVSDDPDLSVDGDKVPTRESVKTYADTKLAKSANLSDLASVPSARDVLDVAPYVATRTALKALDTTKDAVAYLTEAGREGVFVWRAGDYTTHHAADTLEGIYVKATAIASASGSWVRVYEGAIYPEWFGAVGDDAVTDDFAELQAAGDMVIFLGGGKLQLMNKKYRSSAPLDWTLAQGVQFNLAGFGKDVTEIVWDAGSDGLIVEIDGDTRNDGACFIYDYLSLVTLSVVDGTAATFNGVRLAGMTTNMLSSNGVKMKGNLHTQGWAKGALHTDLQGVLYQFPEWIGKFGDYTAHAWEFTGPNSPTDIKVYSPTAYWANSCVEVGGTIEGIVIHFPTFVGCARGLNHNTTSAEPHFGVHGGHINANTYGVFSANATMAVVEGCLIFEWPDDGPSNWAAIQLTAGDHNKVYGNTIHGWNSAATTRFGIVSSSAARRCTIFGNTIRGFSAGFPLNDGIVLGTPDASVREYGNVFDDTSVLNRVSGGATSGSREIKTYAESVLKTLTGGAATETVQVAIPAGVFTTDPVYAHLVSSSGLVYMISEYSFSDALTTATNCVFRVKKQDGTNIAAGAQRFGFLAMGV